MEVSTWKRALQYQKEECEAYRRELERKLLEEKAASITSRDMKKKLDNDGKMVNTIAADRLVIKQAASITSRDMTSHQGSSSRYMEIQGALLYITNDIRPDVAYAVSELAKIANTLTSDWVAVNRLSLQVNVSIPGLHSSI